MRGEQDMFNARELQKKYGSPLYVYMKEVLDTRCMKMKAFGNEVKNNLPSGIEVSLHYSTKANANPFVLKTVRKHGLKVDCMSMGELDINEKSCFTPSEMLYVCNNIKAEEMIEVHDRVSLMCLDSISQVETYGKNFPGTELMVRINTGTEGVGHSEKVKTSGKDTKFGISEKNFEELFEVVEKYNLRIVGIHQHLGSLFLNNKIPDYINGVKSGLHMIKKYFKDVKIVDLGGGFGVPYELGEEELDLSLVAHLLNPILNEFVSGYHSVREFKFEPGRYIPCEAGYLVGEVTAVKDGYIGTNIGMGMLVRPSMYDSYHEITLPESNGELVTVKFCGDICESGDILGKNRTVKLPKVGEPVVVHNAGAYGFSMASNYTGRTRPAEVLVLPNGETKLLRKAETIEDMTRNICWENINSL